MCKIVVIKVPNPDAGVRIRRVNGYKTLTSCPVQSKHSNHIIVIVNIITFIQASTRTHIPKRLIGPSDVPVVPHLITC